MDRIGAGDFASREDIGDFQIGFLRRGFADANRLIGMEHMERFGIGLRIDGYCLQSQSWQARMILTAISPRLAMRYFLHNLRFGRVWFRIPLGGHFD